MKKTTDTIRTITEIGLFAALGFVFDELQGIISKGLFINGGSIGFAMIAVLIISFRRGTLAGFLTGLIMGLLDVATGPYVLNFWQVILDYVISYSLVAVAGLFRPMYQKEENDNKKILILLFATIVGGLAKFLAHYLAGVIFWADPANFAWNLTYMNPYLYCFLYNIAFIGPSIILCFVLLFAIQKKAKQILEVEMVEEEKQVHIKLHDYVINPLILAIGLFSFVFFLIHYINSYDSYYDGFGTDVSFNPDYLISFVSGLLMMIIAAETIIRTFMNSQNNRLSSILYISISIINVIYPISRLIRAYKKEKDPTTYWIWIASSLVVTVALIVLYAYTRKIIKKTNAQIEQTTLSN